VLKDKLSISEAKVSALESRSAVLHQEVVAAEVSMRAI
jgi:hypothetical protein